MITGAVFAVDLRHRHIENRTLTKYCTINLKIKFFFPIELRRNEIVVNESRPSKLFIIRKNEDCQEVKEMSDDSDCHLAMFINGKLKFKQFIHNLLIIIFYHRKFLYLL